jgi:hypothetical protein
MFRRPDQERDRSIRWKLQFRYARKEVNPVLKGPALLMFSRTMMTCSKSVGATAAPWLPGRSRFHAAGRRPQLKDSAASTRESTAVPSGSPRCSLLASAPPPDGIGMIPIRVAEVMPNRSGKGGAEHHHAVAPFFTAGSGDDYDCGCHRPEFPMQQAGAEHIRSNW